MVLQVVHCICIAFSQEKASSHSRPCLLSGDSTSFSFKGSIFLQIRPISVRYIANIGQKMEKAITKSETKCASEGLCYMHSICFVMHVQIPQLIFLIKINKLKFINKKMGSEMYHFVSFCP